MIFVTVITEMQRDVAFETEDKCFSQVKIHNWEIGHPTFVQVRYL